MLDTNKKLMVEGQALTVLRDSNGREYVACRDVENIIRKAILTNGATLDRIVRICRLTAYAVVGFGLVAIINYWGAALYGLLP